MRQNQHLSVRVSFFSCWLVVRSFVIGVTGSRSSGGRGGREAGATQHLAAARRDEDHGENIITWVQHSSSNKSVCKNRDNTVDEARRDKSVEEEGSQRERERETTSFTRGAVLSSLA